MSGKDGGWILPAVTDPPDRVCVQIEIPNDPKHISAFWGALYELTYWNNWQRDDDKRGTEVAAVWKDVWLEAVQANDHLETCAMIEDIRYNDCGLEKLVDDVWTVIPNARFVPLDGSCAMTGGLEIEPSTSEVPLTINKETAHTTDFIILKKKDGVNRYRVTHNGFIFVNEPNVAGQSIVSKGTLSIDTGSASQQGIIITGRSGQTANLQEWRELAGGNVLAAISAAGAATVRNHMLLRGLPATGSAVDMARLYTVFNSSAFSTYTAKVVLAVNYFGGSQDAIAAEGNAAGVKLKFFDANSPVVKPVVSGVRNNNPALASMLTGLSNLGLLTDSTTAGTSGAITSVVVETLPPGSEATADFNTSTGVLTLGIPQGDTGETGATGAQGEPGECPDCLPVDEPENTNDALCGTAQYMVEYIDNLFDDYLTLGDTAAPFTSLVSTALTFVAGPLATFIGDLLQDIIFLGTGGLRAAVSTPVLEEIRCDLYCKLVENGGYSYAALRSWYDDVLADAFDTSNAGLQFWIRILDTAIADNWNQRAYIGSLEPSAACAASCDCASDWCYSFDLAADEGDFYASSPSGIDANYGVWASGGWGSTDDPTYKHVCYIRLNLPTGDYTRGEIETDTVPGAFTRIAFLNSGGTSMGENWAYPPELTTETAVDGVWDNPQKLEIWVQEYEGLPPFPKLTAKIIRVTLYGTGTNPFGSDNCEEE